jgi:hypothetical protein
MNYNDIQFIEETFEKCYERYVRKLNKIKLSKGKTKEGNKIKVSKGKTKEGKQNGKLQLQRR